MEQPPSATRPEPDGPAPQPQPQHDGPVTVTCTREGVTARIEVTGELTDAARRPLVREMTDLMLSGAPLKQVELDLGEVTFLNSAGIAALVQLQKMGQPRGIELVLAVRTAAVTRPLQLSGLWRRFTVLDRRAGHPPETHGAMPPGGEHG